MVTDAEDKELWEAAITAANVGDIETVIMFLSSGGLISRKITADDVTAVASLVTVNAGETLVDIALAKNHQELLACMLSFSDVNPSAAPGEAGFVPAHKQTDADVNLFRRRTWSHKVSHADPGMPDLVRDEMKSFLQRRADQLPYLRSTHVCTFFISKEVGALPAEVRQSALRDIMEAVDTQEQLDQALAWWNGAVLRAEDLPAIYCLYTSADLNCLLHAVSLAMCGVRDTLEVPGADGRCLLRDALYCALDQAMPVVTALLTAGGDFPESELARLTGLARRNKVSLEAGHVAVLASILRRPLIVYAPLHAEPARAAEGVLAERMSGVYLPLAWDPAACSKEPLCLGYTSGHFSALVGNEAAAHAWAARQDGPAPPPAPARADPSTSSAPPLPEEPSARVGPPPPMHLDGPPPSPPQPPPEPSALPNRGVPRIPLPLVDEQRQPLPIQFRPKEADEQQLLRAYLNMSRCTLQLPGEQAGDAYEELEVPAAEQSVQPLLGMAGLFRKIATPDVLLKEKSNGGFDA